MDTRMNDQWMYWGGKEEKHRNCHQASAEMLYKKGIPFFYECKLILYDEYGNSHVLYPDFKILLPDGSVIYWEHFGRMDIAAYRERNYKKLGIYHYNDILPPNNLILTMDDRKGGLDVNGIAQIIENQLVPLFR